MARQERSTHREAFSDTRGFDEQMYQALKAAPWWMISLAVHVLIFLVSNALTGNAPAAAGKTEALTASMAPAPELPEEQLPPQPEETEQVHPTDIVAKEPTIKDAELSDHNET